MSSCLKILHIPAKLLNLCLMNAEIGAKTVTVHLVIDGILLEK